MLKKLLILTIIFSFFSIPLFAQWQWAIRGGSVNSMQTYDDYNNINYIATDQAGNVYFLGQIGGAGVKVANQSLNAYSGISPSASLDIVLSSFTANGTYRWSKVIGGQLNDVGYALKADKNGGIYVTGRIDNPDDNPVGTPNTAVHFDTDTVLPKIPYDSNFSVLPDTLRKQMFLVKYDTSGAFQWLSMPEPDTVTSVGAYLRNSFPIGLDIDANGDLHWLCHLQPGKFGWGNNSIITQAGTYVVKYNSQGNQLGINQLAFNVGRGIELTSLWGGVTHFARNPVNGNYYIAGTNLAKQYSYLSIGGDTIEDLMYLVAFDSNGQLLWKKEGSNDVNAEPLMGNNAINSIQLDSNGDIFLTGTATTGAQFAGYTVSHPQAGKTTIPFLLKLNSSGNLQWGVNSYSKNQAFGHSVAISDTEVAICGEYPLNMHWPGQTDTIHLDYNQGYDAFLARFNKSNGELITMERTNTPFGGASYGNAIAAGPQNTYYLGGNFSMSMFLGPDTLYKVGSQRSFFLTKYECDVPEASMSVSGINATNTVNLVYTGNPADSVKWYLGDGTQVWGDSITHSYATKGKYRVCAMAYFACTEVTVCDSLVAGEISLEEQSLAEVAIYPNPTNGVLKLEHLPKEGQVTLYNLSGKLLLQQDFKSESSFVDLSHLPKGVYLLELRSVKGERVFRKVMKE